MPPESPPTDLDGLRVVAHPLRLRLLSLLTGQSLSAAEAARELGETQANVSYHLRRLAQAGLVELVEETSVRGGLAKRYRHHPASGEALTPGDLDAHRALMRSLAGELVRRAAGYRADSPMVFTDAEVWVSDDAWQHIQELTRALGTAIHDAAGSLDDAHPVRIGATLAVFELADVAPDVEQPPAS